MIAASGVPSVAAYTHNDASQITATTLDGQAVSTPVINGTSGANMSTIYGYSADGDTPDVYAAAGTKILTQRVLGLDAGASITKDYTNAANTTWAYPNIHGDTITTTTGNTAANTNPITCYDPYGTPITSTAQSDADAAPNTAPGAYDPGWLGQHQRYTEHTSALNYTEMGQRVYNPATGRFQQTDPIEGGSANNYDYVNADPINANDLNGTWTWKGLWKGAKKIARNTVRTAAKFAKRAAPYLAAAGFAACVIGTAGVCGAVTVAGLAASAVSNFGSCWGNRRGSSCYKRAARNVAVDFVVSKLWAGRAVRRTKHSTRAVYVTRAIRQGSAAATSIFGSF